jgi:hypothetical protein
MVVGMTLAESDNWCEMSHFCYELCRKFYDYFTLLIT